MKKLTKEQQARLDFLDGLSNLGEGEKNRTICMLLYDILQALKTKKK